ncbi:MAG: hypothetical protein C4547_12670 [Phycisphaerales bacterium]|nr:MAG: hypothetical protein C4547_12670 [Phycisphaerales bacterium]
MTRIAVVTGTRAEYGLLRPVMRAIAQRRELQLGVIATGMHLLKKFGLTVRQIETDRWPILARVRMQKGDDDPLDQARGLSRGVAGIAEALQAWDDHVVLVLGDRIEALAGALAGTATGRIVAHIHGGDVAPGDFDDPQRHAITKLAHVHFAATKTAARRITRMGEEPWRVHVVGAPGLDDLVELAMCLRAASRRAPDSRSSITLPASTGSSTRTQDAAASLGPVGSSLAEAGTSSPFARQSRGAPPRGLKPRGSPGSADSFALVIQHAYGRSRVVERRVAAMVLDAVAAGGLRRVVVYPNSDRGHTGVIDAIEAHAQRSPAGSVEVHRSMPRDAFLRALIGARLVIGNSSCGIIEAASAGTPSVNVGDRQRGREKAGRCVIDADESPVAIRRAIAAALRLRPRPGRTTVYGDGRAGTRIAEILASLTSDEALRQKRMSY